MENTVHCPVSSQSHRSRANSAHPVLSWLTGCGRLGGAARGAGSRAAVTAPAAPVSSR